MSAPKPGCGPADNLLKELQQGRKMQMVEALQVKLLEDQRRSLRHFEMVQDGLARMRQGAMLSGRPNTSMGVYPSLGETEAERRAEALRRMSFSETLRQEVELARAATAPEPPPPPPPAATGGTGEGTTTEEPEKEAPGRSAEKKPSVKIAEKPEVRETQSARVESGGQSLSLKGLRSMKTAGTIKFKHEDHEDGGAVGDTLSSFTDVSPVHLPDDLEGAVQFTFKHVEKTARELDLEDPLWRSPLVRHAGDEENLELNGFLMDFGFCRDGTLLASADDVGHVALWQVGTPDPVFEEKASSCSCFAISPGGKHLAVANQRGRIHVWDTTTYESVTKDLGCEATLLAFAADDKLVVAIADAVKLYAIPEFQEVVELVQPAVRVLCPSPDGSILVTAGEYADPSGTAETGEPAGCVIWDILTFARLGSVLFEGMVEAARFSPDGRRLAVGGSNKLVSIFAAAEEFVHEFDLPCACGVRALAWSPGMRCLASGGDDGLIRVWDLVRKQSLFQLSESQDRVSQISWSQQGILAYSYVKRQAICLARLEEVPTTSTSEQAETVVTAQSSEPNAFYMEGDPSEPSSPQFIFSVSIAGAAPAEEEPPKPVRKQTSEGFAVQTLSDRVDLEPATLDLGSRVTGLQQAQAATSIVQDNGDLCTSVFMPHDQSLMVAGKNVVEYQVHQKAIRREVPLTKPATAMAVSPCGGFLATASGTAIAVQRLTAVRAEPVLSRKVDFPVSALALSSLHFLAVGVQDKVLVCRLSDYKDPKQLVMTGKVHGLAFSPAGDVLAVAAGGDEGRARTSLWQVASDGCSYLGAVLSLPARAVAFSSSGKLLAIGCEDGKIALLSPEEGYKCWSELRMPSGKCRSLCWSNSFLAAAGETQMAIFNVASGQPVLQLSSYQDVIQGVSLDSSGSLLACCFQSHVALYPLEERPEEAGQAKPSMQVPEDMERYKSRGTTANLGVMLEGSGSLMHSIKLTFPQEVEDGDDSELKEPMVRKLHSVGSCGKLRSNEGDGEPEGLPPDADELDLAPPSLAILKPRISVTDLSQDGRSGRNSPEEEDAEAAQLRRRALLARDLGLERDLPCKISVVPGPEGAPRKLKHGDEVCSLSFSPDSTRLAAGGFDQHLVVWHADGLTRQGEHNVEAEVVSVAFSPCGQYVYCGDSDREICVFKGDTLELLGKEVVKETFVSLVGISAPTSLLAVGSNVAVKIYSVPEVQEVISLEHGGQVHSLTFSPSTGLLAAAGGINVTEAGLLNYHGAKEEPSAMKAVIWKGSTDFAGIWDEVATVTYKDACHSASFSPSGNILALAGEDRTICLHSVAKKFQKVELLPCAAGVRCLAWAPNSRLLASAGEDMRVSVWDVLYKRVVLHLPKAGDWLCSIAFSANSKWLASCGYGQDTVDLWHVQVEENATPT